MVTYYVEKDGHIILADSDINKINATLGFMPELQGLELKTTERPIENCEFADTDDYKSKQSQAERERLNLLSLTKREVFLALYKDKGLTPEEIRGSISDTEALIEFDYANEYYRGNPLIEQLGNQLGYTTAELDYLFENGTFEEANDETQEVEPEAGEDEE